MRNRRLARVQPCSRRLRRERRLPTDRQPPRQTPSCANRRMASACSVRLHVGGVALVKSTGTALACSGRPGATTIRACGSPTAAAASSRLGQGRARQARLRVAGVHRCAKPIETWGEFDPGRRIPRRAGRGRRTGHQRLRADSLREPDARRADLHRSSRQHAHGRWPQRHLSRTASWSSSRAGSATPKLIYAITFWTVHTPTRTPSSATSAISSAASSVSTPASTGTRARARCRARIPTGWATIA